MMTKADEKRLSEDPRHRVIVAAAEEYKARLAAIERAKVEALNDLKAAIAATGITAHVVDHAAGYVHPENVWNAIRPAGDKCRVLMSTTWGRDLGQREREIESVTAKRAIIGGDEYDIATGYARGNARSTSAGRINEEDLAKMQAGSLKGWRQKPWPKTP